MADVVDLDVYREQKRLASGEWGIFCDATGAAPDQFVEDALMPLKDSGTPCAIGLMTPVGGPADMPSEQYVGWMLTPELARALAMALLRYATECENGYPSFCEHAR